MGSISRASRAARAAALAGALALALASCAQSETFGSADVIKTVKPSPTASAKASSKPKPTKTAAPTVKPTKTPTRPPAQKQEKVITIKGGQCGIGLCGFEPQTFFVFEGTIIIVKNKDTNTRSWVAENGTFDSGPIKPGGEWRYTASKPGTYVFTDKWYANYQNGRMDVLELPS